MHRRALAWLPSRDGYTLYLDSFSLLHEDARQERVRVGYTACVSGAATFLGNTLTRLPPMGRVMPLRADRGFCTHGMIAALDSRGLSYILTAARRAPVRTLCRHGDAAWTPTAVLGIEVQDVTHEGARLVVLRQQIRERPQAVGKQLLEVPG